MSVYSRSICLCVSILTSLCTVINRMHVSTCKYTSYTYQLFNKTKYVRGKVVCFSCKYGMQGLSSHSHRTRTPYFNWGQAGHFKSF